MLFDSDVVIWLLRGNAHAAQVAAAAKERAVSVVAYMEVLQGARNQREAQTTRAFLERHSFRVLPLTERIGDRAAIYVEEYALSSGVDTIDALIAATAIERGLTLCTGNVKHYRPIADLIIQPFRP
jgi:predicted nucleic acid-binding protein